MAKTLCLTMGLPRSGKSTWARQQGHPIVNPDAIRLALHGRPYIQEAEGFVWAIAKAMVRALFLAGHDTVIVDATNTTRARRDAWKGLSDVRQCKVFRVLPGTAKFRAYEKYKDDPESRDGLLDAIDRMWASWEDVQDDEDLDLI